jgi:hypothetical protein
MDKDRIRVDFFEACAYGICALGAAFDQTPNFQACERFLGLLLLATADDYPDGTYRRMTSQGFDGPAQDRIPAEQAVLFGHRASHSGAAAGGDDQCGGGHGAGV